MAAELYHLYTYDPTTGLAVEHWRYTTAKRAITYNSNTYTALPIKRGAWRRTLDDQEIKIIGPMEVAPFDKFIAINPASVLWLEVFTDTGVPIFQGKALSAKYMGERGTCELSFQALRGMLKGEYPQRVFGPSCNWELFDANCGKSSVGLTITFAVAGTTISGLQLTHATIGTKSTGYFTGGYVKCGSEVVFITGHATNTIHLLNGFVDLSDTNFIAYPGCDKRRATCISKFNNEENFGGYPFTPYKNPVVDGFKDL